MIDLFLILITVNDIEWHCSDVFKLVPFTFNFVVVVVSVNMRLLLLGKPLLIFLYITYLYICCDGLFWGNLKTFWPLLLLSVFRLLARSCVRRVVAFCWIFFHKNKTFLRSVSGTLFTCLCSLFGCHVRNSLVSFS